jgi:hypothetical protein
MTTEERDPAMISIRKISIAISGVAVAAAAVAVGVTGGTAHAQGAASISISGVEPGPAPATWDPEVTVSVTCPAGDRGMLYAGTFQSAVSSTGSYSFTCTGSAQTLNLVTNYPTSAGGAFAEPGPVIAGASLTTTAGFENGPSAGTTATVPLS